MSEHITVEIDGKPARVKKPGAGETALITDYGTLDQHLEIFQKEYDEKRAEFYDSVANDEELPKKAKGDPEKLRAYPGLPVYSDYREMIEKEKPDAVHICTPHFLHAEMAVYALERGINVLCEKPLCISRNQIKAILEAEKKSGAVFGVCLQNRYNPENQFAKKYLEGKKIVSAVAHVCWHRTKEYYQSADWRGNKDKEGGGVLINQAFHTLDLLVHLAGKPERIASSITNLTLKGEIEVEDTAVITSTKGAPITLLATNGAAADMPVVISVKTENENIDILPGAVLINGKPADISEGGLRPLGKEYYGASHVTLIEDFYRCVTSGDPFPINASEAAAALDVILSVYESNGEETEVVYE